jgi:hypothetical protein
MGATNRVTVAAGTGGERVKNRRAASLRCINRKDQKVAKMHLKIVL